MKKIFLAMVLVLAVVGSCWAAPKKSHGGGMHKITEISLSSITVAIGDSGDKHETYQISKDTKITINGSAATPADLRAGMVAKISAGTDKVATSIEAKDAPRTPARHRVG